MNGIYYPKNANIGISCRNPRHRVKEAICTTFFIFCPILDSCISAKSVPGTSSILRVLVFGQNVHSTSTYYYSYTYFRSVHTIT